MYIYIYICSRFNVMFIFIMYMCVNICLVVAFLLFNGPASVLVKGACDRIDPCVPGSAACHV